MRERTVIPPNVFAAANNGDVLMPALRAGLGVAVQPEFLVVDDIAAGRLEVVMLDWTMPDIALNIVTPPGGHRPARVAAVIEFLARQLSGAEWALSEHCDRDEPSARREAVSP